MKIDILEKRKKHWCVKEMLFLNCRIFDNWSIKLLEKFFTLFKKLLGSRIK